MACIIGFNCIICYADAMCAYIWSDTLSEQTYRLLTHTHELTHCSTICFKGLEPGLACASPRVHSPPLLRTPGDLRWSGKDILPSQLTNSSLCWPDHVVSVLPKVSCMFACYCCWKWQEVDQTCSAIIHFFLVLATFPCRQRPKMPPSLSSHAQSALSRVNVGASPAGPSLLQTVPSL